MASQRDIRRRIGAVRNIKQITRAMQFVAASKLKRAQDATLASRPYSRQDRRGPGRRGRGPRRRRPSAPRRREGGKRLVVLITPDRPLSGPLVTNIVRFTAREITESGGELALVTIGRKGRDAMRRARVPIEAHFPSFGDRPSFADVVPVARLLTDAFRSGEAGRVDIAYSHFVSTLVQRPTLVPLLPIVPAEDTAGIPGHQFIFEPSPAGVLEQLVPRYIATRIFQAILESKASEESSRMIAMKNATDNAEDLIEDLTLTYNKIRQANITREMIEIASGAQAR